MINQYFGPTLYDNSGCVPLRNGDVVRLAFIIIIKREQKIQEKVQYVPNLRGFGQFL